MILMPVTVDGYAPLHMHDALAILDNVLRTISVEPFTGSDAPQAAISPLDEVIHFLPTENDSPNMNFGIGQSLSRTP